MPEIPALKPNGNPEVGRATLIKNYTLSKINYILQQMFILTAQVHLYHPHKNENYQLINSY